MIFLDISVKKLAFLIFAFTCLSKQRCQNVGYAVFLRKCYLDSQLLLQDVAYYPVGHPSTEASGLRLCGNAKTAVAGILASLLEQASEGED